MSDANCQKNYDDCVKPYSPKYGEALDDCNDDCQETKDNCRNECYKALDTTYDANAMTNTNANFTEEMNALYNCLG